MPAMPPPVADERAGLKKLARHAGQADIIHESIDGATLYELVAGIEDWEPTPWLTPWGKSPV